MKELDLSKIQKIRQLHEMGLEKMVEYEIRDKKQRDLASETTFTERHINQ